MDELLVECVYSEEGCKHQGQRQLLAVHLKDECTFSDAGKLRSAAESKGKYVEKEEEPRAAESGTETTPVSMTSAESTSQQSPSHRISHLTEQNILLRHRVDTLEGAVQTLRREMASVRTVLNPWMQNAAIPSCSWNLPNRSQASGVREPRQDTSPPFQSTSNNSRSNGEGSSTSHRVSPDNSSRGTESPGEGSRSDGDGHDLASYFPSDDEVRVRRTVPPPPSPPQVPVAQQQAPQMRGQPQQPPRRTGHLHHHSVPSIPGVTQLEGHPSISPALQSLNYLGLPSTSPYASMGLYSSLLPPALQTGPPPLSGGPQYQPQPISISVSDLDTSSPCLSTTLQGLQSNIVSLAASIEEIHKKSDLALALMGGGGTGAAIPGGGVVGEVLRLGEEVMGVRATVQGLRMQMHGLMMGNVVGAGTGPMGFAGRPPPPQPLNANANGEEGSTEGYSSPHISQGLQNQRFMYPVPPGITKL